MTSKKRSRNFGPPFFHLTNLAAVLPVLLLLQLASGDLSDDSSCSSSSSSGWPTGVVSARTLAVTLLLAAWPLAATGAAGAADLVDVEESEEDEDEEQEEEEEEEEDQEEQEDVEVEDRHGDDRGDDDQGDDVDVRDVEEDEDETGDGSDGNCGIKIPLFPLANSEPQAYTSVGPLVLPTLDVEDELWALDDYQLARNMLKRVSRECKHGDFKGRCFRYGLSGVNLTRHALVVASCGNFKMDEEDMEIFQRIPKNRLKPCSLEASCKKIDGAARLVAWSGAVSKAQLQVLHDFPKLFAVEISQLIGLSENEDWSDLSLAPSVELVTLTGLPTGSQLDLLLQVVQNSPNLKSVHIYGRQSLEDWSPVNLTRLCSLRLKHFAAYVLNVGEIPLCFQEMKELQSFYCTNCMLNTVPWGLKGLTSLKSFIAFRQVELVPCLYKKKYLEGGAEMQAVPCKANYETRARVKGDGPTRGRTRSTGHPWDFQEGPSFICRDASFNFPFEEFLKLGWDNIEKVWLDGNFLTGGVPASISKIWPKLRSLDLYDNDMEGAVPASLGELDFVKLQLNMNRFSGPLPPEVAALVHKANLGLAQNPELTGCVPATNKFPGTQLFPCKKSKSKKGKSEL